MVILPVDQGDHDILPIHLAAEFQAAKTGSEDNNVWFVAHDFNSMRDVSWEKVGCAAYRAYPTPVVPQGKRNLVENRLTQYHSPSGAGKSGLFHYSG